MNKFVSALLVFFMPIIFYNAANKIHAYGSLFLKSDSVYSNNVY